MHWGDIFLAAICRQCLWIHSVRCWMAHLLRRLMRLIAAGSTRVVLEVDTGRFVLQLEQVKGDQTERTQDNVAQQYRRDGCRWGTSKPLLRNLMPSWWLMIGNLAMLLLFLTVSMFTIHYSAVVINTCGMYACNSGHTHRPIRSTAHTYVHSAHSTSPPPHTHHTTPMYVCTFLNPTMRHPSTSSVSASAGSTPAAVTSLVLKTIALT